MNRLILAIFIILISGVSIQAQERWQKHNSPVSADLHNTFFVNDSLGWITTHKTGEILHSKDGGTTWEIALKNVPDLHHIELTEAKIWLVGDDGTILSKSR